MTINNAFQVRLVMDMEKAKAYYRDILGFTIDDWGHAVRDGMGFILQEAAKPEDVRPNAKPSPMRYPMDWQGPMSSWDTYGYSDFNGVESLYEEYLSKGAFIVYEPQIEDMGNKKWKEFAIKDVDGYVIVFGGNN